jgi:hypothetical protein
MKQQSKLSAARQQHEETAQSHTLKTPALEFDGPEELLRYDASQTAVPEAVAQRLRQSIGQSELPRRLWWRKLFDPLRGVREPRERRQES